MHASSAEPLALQVYLALQMHVGITCANAVTHHISKLFILHLRLKMKKKSIFKVSTVLMELIILAFDFDVWLRRAIHKQEAAQ